MPHREKAKAQIFKKNENFSRVVSSVACLLFTKILGENKSSKFSLVDSRNSSL